MERRQRVATQSLAAAVGEGVSSSNWTGHPCTHCGENQRRKVQQYTTIVSLTINPEQCLQWLINTDAPAEILVVPHVIHHALALLVLQHIVVLLVDTQAANTVT